MKNARSAHFYSGICVQLMFGYMEMPGCEAFGLAARHYLL